MSCDAAHQMRTLIEQRQSALFNADAVEVLQKFGTEVESPEVNRLDEAIQYLEDQIRACFRETFGRELSQ